jgi:predicted site-specific integrase-resolvase
MNESVEVKEVYSAKEAAKFIGLSPLVIRIYCKKGLLKAHKVGEGKNTRWKIWKKDLIDFVNRNNHEG